MIRRQTRSTLFPYTTLFRSLSRGRGRYLLRSASLSLLSGLLIRPALIFLAIAVLQELLWRLTRSEEHTSELQSRENLVCRLLLEKKKAKPDYFDLNLMLAEL